VDILHISDLHITPPFKDLEEVWLGVVPHVATESVDFIIVSGDLSQAASKPEYDDLLRFAKHHLVKLLRKPEHQRIIFVPGNHDVDWSHSIGTAIPLSSKAPAGQIPRILRDWRQRPVDVQFRLHTDDLGVLQLIDIVDLDNYRHRFTNAQAFLSEFYGPIPSSPAVKHRFNLLSRDPGHDWSAHVFPDQGIAFFGFSSCFTNDRYWTGAHIAPPSILQATLFANEHAKGLMRVAVWHHGLAGSHGSADYLLLHHLGSLHNAGFRLGFHGHTHKGALELLRVVKDQIVVIATGSLGAGSPDRPDAVGNQFSRVRLYPNRVFVALYEREGATGVYQPPQSETVHRLHHGPAEAVPVVRAVTHRRDWTVRRGGIAEVNISFQDVEAGGREIPLAMANHPHGGIRAEHVRWDGGSRPPQEHYLGQGRTRYTFNAEKPSYSCIAWRYYVSNAIALDGAEFAFLEPRRGLFPNLDDDWDAISHIIRLDAEQLVLSLRFLPECGGHLGRAVALVERRVEVRGEPTWERVREEERRCEVTRPTKGGFTELSVAAPVVTYRYSLCYQPRTRRVTLASPASNLSRSVLEKCRGSQQSKTALGYNLTKTVASTLATSLASLSGGRVRERRTWGLGPEAVWIGLLWHESERRLLPAFGQFPTVSWGTSFAAGSGIAGHCFRFSQPVFWHQGATRQTDVIYQRPRRDAAYTEYEWIVCLPLEVAAGGPAVGVISLAGYERNSPIGQRLFQFTEAMAGPNPEPSRLKQLDNLATEINAAFWTTLSVNPSLTSEDRAEAEKSLKALFPERPAGFRKSERRNAGHSGRVTKAPAVDPVRRGLRQALGGKGKR